jgi:hypothetical protein
MAEQQDGTESLVRMKDPPVASEDSNTEMSTLFGQTFRKELEEDDKRGSMLNGNKRNDLMQELNQISQPNET